MIAGAVVGLRAIEPEDLDQLLIWRNRPENRRYFREYREIPLSAQREWFERMLNDGSCAMFAIVHEDWLVGATGLCNIDWLRRSAEVSLYVGDGYIDSVYAPDALHALLVYGFDELGLRRIYAETYAFDVHKQALLLDAGFRQEGVLRDAHIAEGSWHDSYIYSLLSHELDEDTGHGTSW